MKLSVHHIGGRNGTAPAIKPWREFWPIIDLTLYDADEAAANKARELWKSYKNGCASVVVSPRCVGEFEGVSDFYICFDGSASSMLPFNPECSEYAFFTDVRGKGVYKLGDKAKSRVIQVEVRPLSQLIKEGEVAAPDVLSVDAEGAGLQILKGVGEDNFKNIVCLFVEAALIPVHKGEAPLHETLKYLADRDYLCVYLGEQGRYSMAEMHVGAFDRGPYSHIEDAIFLRNPKSVDSPQLLEKLALVSILCGAVSIAYECFKKLASLSDVYVWHEPSENVALNCLHDFYKTWWWYKDLTLPKFNETYTAELNNHYSSTNDPVPKEIQDRWKENYIQKIPKYYASWKDFEDLQANIPTHDVLFEKYGLHEFAKAAKAERERQIAFLQGALGRIIAKKI